MDSSTQGSVPTKSEYMNAVLQLINSTNSFTGSLKEQNVKYLTASQHGTLWDLEKKIKNAESTKVLPLAGLLNSLDAEIDLLVKRFQIIRNSYKQDISIKTHLGDFGRDPDIALNKLVGFIDSSISQLDSIMTAYSAVEKEKRKTRSWLLTVLSHNATQSAADKARGSNEILKEISTLIETLRPICHDAKLELLNIRSTLIKSHTSET